MLSKTRSRPIGSPAPGEIPDTITRPVNTWSSVATDPDIAPAQPSAARDTETRRERSHGNAHRSRLYRYAILAVALVALLIALAASDTAPLKINSVFGNSHVSLVWLALFAALLGWLLGLVATGTFHWRTRASQRPRGGRS